MNVFERFIANECPPESGSVLWINTSKTPLTLNMRVGNEWQVLGAFYDAKSMEKILATLGEFEDPENTVANILEYLKGFFVEITEQDVQAMFVTNNN